MERLVRASQGAVRQSLVQQGRASLFQVVSWVGDRGILGRVQNLDWDQAQAVMALARRTNPKWIHLSILAMR